MLNSYTGFILSDPEDSGRWRAFYIQAVL